MSKFIINIVGMYTDNMKLALFPKKLFPMGPSDNELCSTVATVAEHCLRNLNLSVYTPIIKNPKDMMDALIHFSDSPHHVMITCGYRASIEVNDVTVISDDTDRVKDPRLLFDNEMTMRLVSRRRTNMQHVIDETIKRCMQPDTVENCIIGRGMTLLTVLIGFNPTLSSSIWKPVYTKLVIEEEIDYWKTIALMPKYMHDMDRTSYEVTVRLMQFKTVELFSEENGEVKFLWDSYSTEHEMLKDIENSIEDVLYLIRDLNP